MFTQNAQNNGIALIDAFFTASYRQARINFRRMTHLVMALLPLMVLLVGSCKTSQLPSTFGEGNATEQVRSALFPDRIKVKDPHYYPAQGYLQQARSYVSGAPASLNMLSETEVAYLFGKPTLQRRDADAEIWQYKGAKCVVDFYFYDTKEPKKSASSAVSYIEMRLRDELEPGARPRTAPLPDNVQSKCLRNVIDEGDFLPSGA